MHLFLELFKMHKQHNGHRLVTVCKCSDFNYSLIILSCKRLGFYQRNKKRQWFMYTFAALMNSPVVVTCCCFPVETAGGDDATLGRCQSSHSLLCDAPGLGRHSRYCAAWLHNNPTTTLSTNMCDINILGGKRYLFVVSNRSAEQIGLWRNH